MRVKDVTILVVVCALAGQARAEVIVVDTPTNSGKEADFQRAKASSADANKAFENGNIASALAHAESAYRAYPNATTANQMAQIYIHAKRPKAAFKWLLAARNHKPPEAFLAAIQSGLETQGAAAKFGAVKIDTTPQTASVSIDDEAASTVGGRWVGLSFGDHTLQVSAAGHATKTQQVTVGTAELATVTVQLDAVATPAPTAGEGGSIVVPLALIISGVLVAGGGGGLLAWGLGSGGSANDASGTFRDPGGTPETAAQGALDDYNGNQANAEAGTYAGYALLGVGGALIVAGAVLWALQPSAAPEGEGSTDVTATPGLMPGGGGMVLSGRF